MPEQLSTPENDPVRAKIDEWLAGIQATRDGVFDVFYIEAADGRSIEISQRNADKIEARIRAGMRDRYPDLVPIEPQEAEQ